MESELLDQAAELIAKVNSGLEPQVMEAALKRDALKAYARLEKLVAFGVAALAGSVRDAAVVAGVTGTSMGRAKAAVATGKALDLSADLSLAMQRGSVSLDQAAEIASAEESAPGVAAGLLAVAESESFQVLREKSRKVKLEAEQHRDLSGRQREARSARSYSDELGMIHIHMALEPHVGAPIAARAEAEATRIAKAARRGEKDKDREPFERCLADAYARLLSGAGKGRATRPELVVLVSHEVATRGWRDVKDGEVCKIPGVGPVSPQVAKDIAQDAFLNGVFYDGKDLRQWKRWSRRAAVEVQVALELGKPPDFDGVKCVDCGRRLGTEFDHVQPHVAGGPYSTTNIDPRCWPCHVAKTERDRRAGLLTPQRPDAESAGQGRRGTGEGRATGRAGAREGPGLVAET